MVGGVVKGEQGFTVGKGTFEDGDGNSSGMFHHLVTSPIIILSIFKIVQSFANRFPCAIFRPGWVRQQLLIRQMIGNFENPAGCQKSRYHYAFAPALGSNLLFTFLRPESTFAIIRIKSRLIMGHKDEGLFAWPKTRRLLPGAVFFKYNEPARMFLPCLQKYFLAILHDILPFMPIEIDVFLVVSIAEPISFQPPARCASGNAASRGARGRGLTSSILKGFTRRGPCTSRIEIFPDCLC